MGNVLLPPDRNLGPMANVALVVLDTLRKDAFDEHFGWLPGTRFENAWAPSGWTVAVHGSLFGGAYPSELGVFATSESLSCDRPVLAERLSAAGYTTRAFSANAYVSPAFDYDRGFDQFESNWRGAQRDPDLVDWSEFISETRGEGPTRFLRALYRAVASDADTIRSLKYGAKMKADDIGLETLAGADSGARQALARVREAAFGDDEFYFLNLMEAHSPYDPPSAYRTVDPDAWPSLRATVTGDLGEDPAVVRQAYDDSVRYLSDVYRDIFAELAADFDCVVTLGDHGESFGECGVWGHNYGIAPPLTRVPLSVYTGDDARTTCGETVGLIDVHRTVLNLAGLDDGPSRGVDLLDDPRSRPLLVERHGLTATNVEKLRGNSVAEDTIDGYDSVTRGVVLPGGYYGWEHRDGFREQGQPDVPDPRQ